MLNPVQANAIGSVSEQFSAKNSNDTTQNEITEIFTDDDGEKEVGACGSYDGDNDSLGSNDTAEASSWDQAALDAALYELYHN